MPTTKINGVNLYWEMQGTEGEPLVLVHGSWGDHHNWDTVAGELAKTYRVLTYDRRGHSLSERPVGQGDTEEDVADLIALVEHVQIAPAHIVGNSFGAAIALKTAARRPDIFQTLVVHEPPLFGLIRDDSFKQNLLPLFNSRIETVMEQIGAGEYERAAALFVDTIAFGPGAWQGLPAQAKQTFIANAPTFADEIRDPGSQVMNTAALKEFGRPALLTSGTASTPFFLLVVNEIVQAFPEVERRTFEGAGHVPHLTHPDHFIQVVKNFCKANEKSGAAGLPA